jgi:hypothetical protein
MNNPYQTIADSSTGDGARPSHALWYWASWSMGTIAIVLSCLGLVSPAVGWIGFTLALVASVASLVCSAGQLTFSNRHHDLAVLTDEMIAHRDHGFRMALRLCRQGGTVLYRGIAIMFSRHTLVCSTISSLPPSELDEPFAITQANAALETVQALASAVPEASIDISERPPVTILISEFGRNGVEICRVVHGRVTWRGL